MGAGVVAAMSVGGVLGWFGASLMKPDNASPKSATLSMPRIASVAKPPKESEPIFSESTLAPDPSLDTEVQPVEVPQSDESITEQEIASLPPAEVSPEVKVANVPTWQQNALPFSPQANRPMIAIVIDDMGIDIRRSSQVVAMKGPFTTSYLSYGRKLAEQTKASRKAGHELLLHMPMEPQGTGYDPGPDVLLTSMSPEAIRSRLSQSLGSFDGYVGINNHMGSKFTSSAKSMRVVVHELHGRGLLFLDSLTSGKSVGARTAEKEGVPNLTRDVFLDDSPRPKDIARQLKRVEAKAKARGYAIAIGHPRDTTIAALRKWLPELEAKGFQLVPLSTVAKVKYGIQP